MSKQYRLLQDYVTPCRAIRIGVIKPAEEWIKVFPELINVYNLEIKKDWFEEVKEKEFEILQYSVNTSGKEWLYLRIKRLSDGINFSLNDKVLNSRAELKTIVGFKPHNEFMQVELSSGKFADYLANLSELKHHKKPLFKDFLGNEVMEGEEFYFVNPMFWDVEKGKALYGALKKEIAHFKFKKDAENYKEQNKPIYSKKQVLDTLSKSCNYLGAVFLAESIKKDLGL